MDRQEFTQFISEVFQNEILGLNGTKGSDYSGNEDAFRNFKDGATRLGLSMEQVWAVYCSKHMDAIWTYVKDGGNLKSEPIEGRIDDAILYLFLLRGMVLEQNSDSGEGKAKPLSGLQAPGKPAVTPVYRDSAAEIDGALPPVDGELWTREELAAIVPKRMHYIPADIRKTLPDCNCDAHNEFHSAACNFAIYLNYEGREPRVSTRKPQPNPRT